MTKQTMVKTKEPITAKRTNMKDGPAIPQKCCHFWVIEAPAGPISQGVCQLCGMKKDFDNYLTACLKENR